MAKSNKKQSCNLLDKSIGILPFADVKNHLVGCPDCQKYLEENFYFYQKQPQMFLVSIELGLTKEKFLEHWHLKMSSFNEKEEFIIARLRNRMESEEGFLMLRKLMALQARAINGLTTYLGKSYYKDELRLIVRYWKDFQNFLGKEETAYLLDQKPEDFEKMLGGWEIILTGKKTGK